MALGDRPAGPDADPGKVLDLFQGKAFTEDQAGVIFADRYVDWLAYCHTEGVWREFDGSIWRTCKVPQAFEYARRLARELATRSGGATTLLRLKAMDAITTLGARDLRIAKSAESWNRDPWLLGTPAGTVNLNTGKLRPPTASDFITQSTAVAPAPWADCPTWRSFLGQATAGDEDLQRFLQQIAGYALTGSTREQSLFFIYGPGGNGKGIFVNTLATILGDYAVTAAMNTFTASRSERHSTDMAMLAGARLVTASETNEGQVWDQQKIGALTGEDMITARFMRKDFFTYRPQFTLVIVGNYKPSLASVNDAMKRRFNIIPFEQKPDQPDHELFNRLKGEWPGILKWMIEGCLDWQAEGLQRASSVVAKTQQYFADEDTLRHWLEDETEFDTDNWHLTTKSSELFRSWADYCKLSGENGGNAKTFKASMEKAGFHYKRVIEGVYVHGVRLKPKIDPFANF